MSMNMGNSAIKKGETLIDTAMTLNAMHPDIIVIRHQDSGACNLLSQKGFTIAISTISLLTKD